MMINTSSFIWLGLVAALIVGLTLTLCRTRLGARHGAPFRPATEQQVRPVLWEAYVSPDELEGGIMRFKEKKSTRGWGDALPLALRLPQRQPQPTNLATKSPKPSRLRRLFTSLRRSEISSEQEAQPISYTDGEISTIILLPRQQKPTKEDSSDCSQPDFMYEYALGTKCTRCPDVRPPLPQPGN